MCETAWARRAVRRSGGVSQGSPMEIAMEDLDSRIGRTEFAQRFRAESDVGAAVRRSWGMERTGMAWARSSSAEVDQPWRLPEQKRMGGVRFGRAAGAGRGVARRWRTARKKSTPPAGRVWGVNEAATRARSGESVTSGMSMRDL